jgi:hypothetical protein
MLGYVFILKILIDPLSQFYKEVRLIVDVKFNYGYTHTDIGLSEFTKVTTKPVD